MNFLIEAFTLPLAQLTLLHLLSVLGLVWIVYVLIVGVVLGVGMWMDRR